MLARRHPRGDRRTPRHGADDDYGIAQSALQLLGTLERDHEPRREGSYLLCHACGYPVHFGCSNFGTDWAVRHEGDKVLLSDVTKYTETETRFDVEARLPFSAYRDQVERFARAARDFYFSDGARQIEDHEKDLHDQFWGEFARRLGPDS